MIYGQDEILTYLKQTPFADFPRTCMLIGPKGSGKHLIAEYYANLVGINLVDLSENINLDMIDYISTRPDAHIYLIDANKIDIKDENTILKLLEEPFSNTCIMILAEQESKVLPTVQNRCQKIKLKPYTDDILRMFLNNSSEEALRYARTPGQLLNLAQQDFNALKELAEKIYTKITSASIPNMLTISDKIAFKSEKNKFDFEVFMNVLHATIHRIILTQNVPKVLYDAYKLTNQLYQDQYIAHIDRKVLFENFLCQLKKLLTK